VIRKNENRKPSRKEVEFPLYRWKKLEYTLDKLTGGWGERDVWVKMYTKC